MATALVSNFATLAPPKLPVAARPRRILLLSTDMGMGGGAEEQVIQLAYKLQARGWMVRIVSLLPPSPMPPDFARRGIPLEHLGMRRGVPDVRGAMRLARRIREFRPDVVHSHLVHANLLARIARVLQPFPVLICTHHSLTMAGVKKDHTRVFEIAHRVTDRLADITTAICQASSDYCVRRGAVPPHKMMTVPNGIDTQRFVYDADRRNRMRRELAVEGSFVWLAIGRLESQKNYPMLLRAFARLGDGPRVLLICGQGALTEPLRHLADELGIADRVRFLGLRGDIPSVMSAADAFALSSNVEGLPLVLLEASAAGLPIVATDISGNPEVVAEGVSGYLCPPGDSSAFAAAMARIEAMPKEDRHAMGAAGRQRAQNHFEMDRVVDRWEELYRRFLLAGTNEILRDVATAE